MSESLDRSGMNNQCPHCGLPQVKTTVPDVVQYACGTWVNPCETERSKMCYQTEIDELRKQI
jgi:hypothetical protein